MFVAISGYLFAGLAFNEMSTANLGDTGALPYCIPVSFVFQDFDVGEHGREVHVCISGHHWQGMANHHSQG